jgi:hypothetical protein
MLVVFTNKLEICDIEILCATFCCDADLENLGYTKQLISMCWQIVCLHYVLYMELPILFMQLSIHCICQL